MKSVTALILAGGQGTRLGALYPNLPKPMMPVRNKPFLHWLTAWLAGQGVENFVFSTGHRGEQIEEWLGETALLKKAQWKVLREPAPLGTGGGMRACLHLCGDTVMVANGDSLAVTPLPAALAIFDDACVDGVVIGKNMKDGSRYGTLEADAEGFLTGFREKHPGAGLINTGVYFFRRKALEVFPAGQKLSMEYDVMPALIARGARIRVHAVEEETPFLDIGTPETLAQAAEFIGRHLAGA